jgi:hypothetical protein
MQSTLHPTSTPRWPSGTGCDLRGADLFRLLDREPVNDIVEEEVRVIGERITLNIRDGALNALVNDATINVGGTDFLIRDIGNPQLDGLRELTLVEA